MFMQTVITHDTHSLSLFWSASHQQLHGYIE